MTVTPMKTTFQVLDKLGEVVEGEVVPVQQQKMIVEEVTDEVGLHHLSNNDAVKEKCHHLLRHHKEEGGDHSVNVVHPQ